METIMSNKRNALRAYVRRTMLNSAKEYAYPKTAARRNLPAQRLSTRCAEQIRAGGTI